MDHTLLEDILHRLNPYRGLLFGSMIVIALIAFEMFNFTTTDFAFSNLLGDVTVIGIPWATILAIAFCGIDFAGIARLFTPERDQRESSDAWYLFGAWLIAATMNAILTWWGVSLAVLQHQNLGNEMVDRATLIRIVSVFIAVMVWLIRVLLLGTFSLAGDRLFSQSVADRSSRTGQNPAIYRPLEPPAGRPVPLQKVPSFKPFQQQSNGVFRSIGNPATRPGTGSSPGGQPEYQQEMMFR